MNRRGGMPHGLVHRSVIALGAVAVAAVMSIGIAAAPAVGAAANWQDAGIAVPDIGSGSFTAVSCPSSSLCFAVGDYLNSAGTDQVFAATRTSGTWSEGVGPTQPAYSRSSTLAAVSCPATYACGAVGSYVDADGTQRPLAEGWDGSRWNTLPTGLPSGATSGRLLSISCWSATGCLAVGGATPGHTLALQWDGLNWTPTPTPDGGGELRAVSCLSASFCAAVGTASGGGQALVWNGSAWALSALATPTSGHALELDGISCLSATACVAVGDYTHQTHGRSSEQTLAEHWNGISWSVRPTPNPTSVDVLSLQSLSCVTASYCLALGPGAYVAGSRILGARWNGSAWTAVTLPDLPAGQRPLIGGITCLSTTRCLAVGSTLTYPDVGGQPAIDRTLVEGWDGSSWSVKSSYNPVAGADGRVNDVSCPSSTWCVAVGDTTGADGHDSTLIEAWDGSEWHVHRGPNPTGTFRTVSLGSVSCFSRAACVAVGTATGANGEAHFSEIWNGHVWRLVSFATGRPAAFEASQVSCASADSCVVVGDDSSGDSNGNSPTTLPAQRWDGTRWSALPALSVSGARSVTTADVSCSGATCVVVGGYTSAGSVSYALAASLTGSAWTRYALPAGSNRASGLVGVSCVSARSCTAIGSSVGRGSASHVYAADFIGSSWTQVPVPDSSAVAVGISCSTRTTCLAIGYVKTGAGTSDQVAAERNGSTWTLDTLPPPITPNVYDVEVTAVSCLASAACRIVGSDTGGFTSQVTFPYALQRTG